jgi:hypothetical protein
MVAALEAQKDGKRRVLDLYKVFTIAMESEAQPYRQSFGK